MGKDKTFGAKLAKAAGGTGAHCKVCGELLRYTKVIETVKDESKNSFGFKESFVGVCKCNVQQVQS